jgi:hypothetical protein
VKLSKSGGIRPASYSAGRLKYAWDNKKCGGVQELCYGRVVEIDHNPAQAVNRGSSFNHNGAPIMDPADPKIEEAIGKIADVYGGQSAAHAYYDVAGKLYIFVVSGEEAEAYQRAIKSIHSLASKAKKIGKRKRA